MIIARDPDRFIPTFTERRCSFHVKNPSMPYAGCTCSAGYGERIASPEEYKANRRKRLVERRAWLLEQLQEIEGELA